MKLINESQIIEKWAPILEQESGIEANDKYKLSWLSKYCHNHALNEGFTYPQASLLNTPGMGNVMPASNAAGGAGLFYSNATTGSGDKFPSLLPMAIKIAARTVGFDIVNVIPMQGPSGVLTYMEYVYAGGKDMRGSYPHPTTGNPGINTYYEKPLIFKVKTSSYNFNVGDEYTFVEYDAAYANNTEFNAITAKYVGKSRIDGYPIFRITGELTVRYDSSATTIVKTTLPLGSLSLADVFDGTQSTETTKIAQSAALSGNNPLNTFSWSATVSGSDKPSLVSTLEDHIAGFTGAGPNDSDDWSGSYVDGTKPYEPMRRGVGEEQYHRNIGLQVFTKFVEAQTYQIAATVTTEQIQDLSRQHGIDVVSVIQNALVNEVTQSINRHILSRAFALGWSNHIEAEQVEGVNLNISVNPSHTAGTLNTPPFITKDNTATTMTVPFFAVYSGASAFENMSTVHDRIFAKILAAGNLISQRGRRGPANFIVTNLQVASAIQKHAQYSFAPMVNTINQNNGTLYPVGTLAGMTIYVDPNMAWNDTRVLVGRKGSDEEPGLKFMPYLLTETIQTIAEGTMAPKIAVKSRYALVEAGFFPQTQYVTFWVTGASISSAVPII